MERKYNDVEIHMLEDKNESKYKKSAMNLIQITRSLIRKRNLFKIRSKVFCMFWC